MASPQRRGLGQVQISRPKTDLQRPAETREGDSFDQLKRVTEALMGTPADMPSERSRASPNTLAQNNIADLKSAESVSVPLPKRPKSKTKNEPLTQRRFQVTKSGERTKRFEIYLTGTDLERFEQAMSKLRKMMPGGKPVKNNDLIRCMLPTLLKILRYVDKSQIPIRPQYGTNEYRQFIEDFGAAVWEATLVGITTELRREGLQDLSAAT